MLVVSVCHHYNNTHLKALNYPPPQETKKLTLAKQPPIPKITSDDDPANYLEFKWHREGYYVVSGFKFEKAQANITIPATCNSHEVRAISDQAFYGNSVLKTVQIEDGLKEIGSKAFDGCDHLCKINIPSTVIKIGWDVLPDYHLLSDGVTSNSPVLFDWWVRHHRYNTRALGDLKNIDLGNYTNSAGKPFTIIGPMAFSSDSSYFYKFYASVESITLQDGVREIDTGAFYDCKDLSEIIIPESVVCIQNTIFNSLTFKYAENICVANNSPVLFDWWVNKHEYNSQTLSDMSYIDLSLYTNSASEPFEIIGEQAFWKDDNLRTIYLDTNIRKIDARAFAYCNNLQKVTIRGTTTTFDDAALQSAPKIIQYYVYDETTVAERLKYLGVEEEYINIAQNDFFEKKFYRSGGKLKIEVSGLTSKGRSKDELTIPADASFMANGVFLYCSRDLKSVIIPQGCKLVRFGYDWQLDLPQTTLVYVYDAELFKKLSETLRDASRIIMLGSDFDVSANGILLKVHKPSDAQQNLVIHKNIYGVDIVGIGSNAFKDCSQLTNIEFEDGINLNPSQVNQQAFVDLSNKTKYEVHSHDLVNVLKGKVSDDGNIILMRNDFDITETGVVCKLNATTKTDLVISKKIGGVDVKEIGAKVFSDCSPSLASITIECDNVTFDQSSLAGVPEQVIYYVKNDQIKAQIQRIKTVHADHIITLLVEPKLKETVDIDQQTVSEWIQAEQARDVAAELSDLCDNWSVLKDAVNTIKLISQDSETVTVKINVKSGYTFDEPHRSQHWQADLTISNPAIEIEVPTLKHELSAYGKSLDEWINYEKQRSFNDQLADLFSDAKGLAGSKIFAISYQKNSKKNVTVTITLKKGFAFSDDQKSKQWTFDLEDYSIRLDTPIARTKIDAQKLTVKNWIEEEKDKRVGQQLIDLFSDPSQLSADNVESVDYNVIASKTISVTVKLYDRFVFDDETNYKTFNIELDNISLDVGKISWCSHLDFKNKTVDRWISDEKKKPIDQQLDDILINRGELSASNVARIDYEKKGGETLWITISLGSGFAFSDGEAKTSLLIHYTDYATKVTPRIRDKIAIHKTIDEWIKDEKKLNILIETKDLFSDGGGMFGHVASIDYQKNSSNSLKITVTLNDSFVFSDEGAKQQSWTIILTDIFTPAKKHASSGKVVAGVIGTLLAVLAVGVGVGIIMHKRHKKLPE